MDIAQALRRELERRGLSQGGAAGEMGVGQTQVSRWLRGERPSADNCRRLAEFLGIDSAVVMQAAGYDDGNLPKGAARQMDPDVAEMLDYILEEVILPSPPNMRWALIETVRTMRMKLVPSQGPEEAGERDGPRTAVNGTGARVPEREAGNGRYDPRDARFGELADAKTRLLFHHKSSKRVVAEARERLDRPQLIAS